MASASGRQAIRDTQRKIEMSRFSFLSRKGTESLNGSSDVGVGRCEKLGKCPPIRDNRSTRDVPYARMLRRSSDQPMDSAVRTRAVAWTISCLCQHGQRSLGWHIPKLRVTIPEVWHTSNARLCLNPSVSYRSRFSSRGFIFITSFWYLTQCLNCLCQLNYSYKCFL